MVSVILGIICCIFEALLEVLLVLGVVVVPFAILGVVFEVIKRCFVEKRYKGKFYISGTNRAKMHRKVYDFLINKGYDSNVAYKTATKITHWE